MRSYLLLAVAALSFGCAGEATRDASASDFDFLTLQWEADGATHDGVRICELLSSGDPIALDSEVLLGLQHFVSAQATGEEKARLYSVEVNLTPEGSRRLREQSTENLGRKLAVVIDGEVVALPTVMAPLDTRAIPLMPIATLQEADSLAALINSAIRERTGRT